MTLRTAALGLALLLVPATAVAAPQSLEPVLAEIAKDRLFASADVGVLVVDLASGEEVFSRNADVLLAPASTTKVLTAAAALKTLGPAYRFTTELAVDGRPDANGVVKGNLYVRGGGDPTMVIEKLWKLVADLQLAGVRKVQGDLVYDETFFDADHALAGWDKPHDVETGPAYFPALSALSLNFNTATIAVRPGPSVGAAAPVQLETMCGDSVSVGGSVRTGPPGSRRSVQIEREITKDGQTRFTASGSIPADGDVTRYYRSVADPTAQFVGAFQAALAERGVEIGGTVRPGAVPKGIEPLVELQSPPLTTVLMDMNKFSSNFIAEQVLRTLGAEVDDKPGSTAAGIAVLARYLEGIGLEPEQDFVLVNGSGLSRDARITPAALTAVLIDMARDPRVGPEFEASLSLAGWDGTLSGRLEDAPGMLRGKTGTIGGVHCLTGYLTAGTGDRYAFAFLVNRVPGDVSQVRALHDRFARRMLDLGDGSAASSSEEGR